MELEFDKEIDAILRKARPAKGVLVGDEPAKENGPNEQKKHIDADSIAAFTENALPEKAKRLYMEHFADCDRCRKQLSLAMQMNAEATASEYSHAPHVIQPVTEIIPWYQGIFRVRNIALTMGALVLVFSSILGFLVLQNRNLDSNATVSQIIGSDQQRAAPNFNSQSGEAIPTPTEFPMVSANSASNTTLAGGPAANAAMAARPESAAKPADDAPSGSQIDGASGSKNNSIVDGQEAANVLAEKNAAQPVPHAKTDAGDALPPATTDSTLSGVSSESDDKKLASKRKKEESKDELAKGRAFEDRGRRDMPAPAAKAGPVQSNQVNNTYQMSVVRTVGGKSFSNRSGAWYDSAYNGQSTTNVRRGSNEYKKLDSGLRNIADTLGGTVVVVWKSKAYRIAP